MPSISAVPKLEAMTASFTSALCGSAPSRSASSSAPPSVPPAGAPESSSSLGSSSSTDTPMGSIITAVAVLETHMLRNAVASMNPATIWAGLVPITRTVRRAILRCRFQRCMASASRNPPMNRKMMLLP